MIRWRGGFVAVGAVVQTGTTSRTPVWTSPDGQAWQQLDPGVFGPKALVIGVGETSTGVVAVTLQGGKNLCSDEPRLSCMAVSKPFTSWTSSDGVTWTAHPGPALAMPPPCPGCDALPPILRAGRPGLIVLYPENEAPTSGGAAFSRDGITWEILPRDAFPAAFHFYFYDNIAGVGNIAGFGSGFVAVGQSVGTRQRRALALWSADGRHWHDVPLPTAGLPMTTAESRYGTSASGLVAGATGLIADGSTNLSPGRSLWWSSVDGLTWRAMSGYPPLGVRGGEDQGSGMGPNGSLLGDGERMLAYQFGRTPKAWTSFGPRPWQVLKVSGGPPTSRSAWPQLLTLFPVGLLWIGDDGSAWYGEPMT